MEVKYDDDDLERLETDPSFRGKWGLDVVRAFRKQIQVVRSVLDERALFSFRSLHFEKLQGSRSHQHSLRLNDQWRLVVEVEKGNPKNAIRVIAIEDYH